MSLLVTTSAEAHKGKVWAHDQPPALRRSMRKKNRFHTRATHAQAQSSPKAQVDRTVVSNLSLNMYPLLNFL